MEYGQIILIIVITIFALFAISRSYLRLKHGNESILEFLLWTGIWTLAIVIVFYPEITKYPAQVLGIGRGIDVIVYFGLVFLFYSIYRIYAKIEKLETEITKLARNIALEKK